VTTASRIVVMGPAGSGKSLIGAELAARLGLPFVDADDLHPAANVAKMAAGTPLDDEDRMPWLDVVGAALRDRADGAVIACSALARRYRDRIRAIASDAWFVELRVDRGELARRMTTRDHFMPSSLLDSQLDALEHLGADEAGVAVVNDGDPAAVVERIRAALGGGQSLR
jgi:carbohydrate kinase (thermoresistant glucokinase family)